MRVLVVDDEPQFRRALERALKLEGYEVEVAGNGVEALKTLSEGPADAVVLDVLMPKLDGLETCRRLRAVGDSTPVLMLTARDAVEDRVDGLDAGADDYLVKPFALEELLARLRALLRRHENGGGDAIAYADLSLNPATREVRARRAPDRADQDRVRAARAAAAPPEAGPRPRADLRGGLGLRLRPDLELARGLHRLPAAQDRGVRRAAPDPHGARRRLRAAREVSLRRRLTLLSALAVALAVIVASVIVYAIVRDQLLGQIDDTLRERAGVANVVVGGQALPSRHPAGPGPRRRRRGHGRRRAGTSVPDPGRPRTRPPPIRSAARLRCRRRRTPSSSPGAS